MYKIGVITPYSQYFYRRIGQGLKGSSYTYYQFSNLVFGKMPPTETYEIMPSLIRNYREFAFSPFIDNYNMSASTFKEIYIFIHKKYLPRVVQGLVYRTGKKSFFFIYNIDLIGFTGGVDGLRPSVRHRDRIIDWPAPTNREELDTFLQLTPQVKSFIPGRASLAIIIRKAYRSEEYIILPTGYRSKRIYQVENAGFTQTEEYNVIFSLIKKAIRDNVIAPFNINLAPYLAVNTSGNGSGGVLFQLYGYKNNNLITDKNYDDIRIIIFMSFSLVEREKRYHITEREYLRIIKYLAEVKWLVQGSKYPLYLYIDHTALTSILNKGETTVTPRIISWQERLNKYDFVAHYRPRKSTVIGIADRLSRIPPLYQ